MRYNVIACKVGMQGISSSSDLAKAMHSVFRKSRIGDCSVCGTVAAVRLATNAETIKAAIHEAAVYEHLRPLQGLCVPRVLDHGATAGGDAYFVATEFIQVFSPVMLMKASIPFAYSASV